MDEVTTRNRARLCFPYLCHRVWWITASDPTLKASRSPTATTTKSALRRRRRQYTMGGDHRCPVCQATFTRPQHVARHMRLRTSPLLPFHPAHLPLSTNPNQTPVTVRTNANTVEINLQGGTTTSTSPSNHLILCVLATFSPATSINATPTKCRAPTAPPAAAERAPLPLLARQPPSKPATNASSPVSRAMVPCHAVCNPISAASSAHDGPFPLFSVPGYPLPPGSFSQMRFLQGSLHVCQISPANGSGWSRSPSPFLLLLLLTQWQHWVSTAVVLLR